MRLSPIFMMVKQRYRGSSKHHTNNFIPMAFTEFELKRWEVELDRFIEHRRPPLHIRAQLDFGYRIDGQSVMIFEIRPDWQDPTVKREFPVAKATHVRTKDEWRVFWMRADLKWHGYEPNLSVASLEEFLQVVDDDAYCCFFG